MQRPRAVAASPGYAWMLDLLYADEPAVAWARAGSLPSDYDRVEQLAVLPVGRGRSFIVSLAARRGSASALTSYNALRSRPKRLVRSVLGLGLRTGVAQLMVPQKVDVGVKRGSTQPQLEADLLAAHLGRLLGADGIVVAFGCGDGPYRKPVLQVFSSAGTPLGYVKVGWNAWTRDGVRREADALSACASHAMQLGAPTLLGLYSWHDLDLLVTEPLPSKVSGIGAAAALPDAAVLREISGLAPSYQSQLKASPWWCGVRARIQRIPAELGARAELERAATKLELGYGTAELEFGFCHGDLVPWNLARLGERLYAWDWESSAPNAPLGFDAVHYYFQVAFVGQRLPLAEAAAIALSSASPTLRELGVPAAFHRLVGALHLIELFLRHEEARSASGDADERFSPAIASVLERRLADVRAAGLTAVRSMA